MREEGLRPLQRGEDVRKLDPRGRKRLDEIERPLPRHLLQVNHRVMPERSEEEPAAKRGALGEAQLVVMEGAQEADVVEMVRIVAERAVSAGPVRLGIGVLGVEQAGELLQQRGLVRRRILREAPRDLRADEPEVPADEHARADFHAGQRVERRQALEAEGERGHEREHRRARRALAQELPPGMRSATARARPAGAAARRARSPSWTW